MYNIEKSDKAHVFWGLFEEMSNPINVWCEFEEDPLEKKQGVLSINKKLKVPPYAQNGTAERQKLIGM